LGADLDKLFDLPLYVLNHQVSLASRLLPTVGASLSMTAFVSYSPFAELLTLDLSERPYEKLSNAIRPRKACSWIGLLQPPGILINSR
jgi:hypothetical protein